MPATSMGAYDIGMRSLAIRDTIQSLLAAAWCLLAGMWILSIFTFVGYAIDAGNGFSNTTIGIARGSAGAFVRSGGHAGFNLHPRDWALCIEYALGRFARDESYGAAWVANGSSARYAKILTYADYEVPLPFMLVVSLPVFVGPLVRYRFRLWMMLVWMALIAMACAYYFQPAFRA